MAVIAQDLQDLEASLYVIPMMLKAYIFFLQGLLPHEEGTIDLVHRNFSMRSILVFFRDGSGPEFGPQDHQRSGLCSCDVFHRLLASYSSIKTFVQGVFHIVTSVQPSVTLRDLNLVLLSLQTDIPLSTYSQGCDSSCHYLCKASSELEDLSFKVPILVLQDKVTLRLRTLFLIKNTS